MRVLLVEDDEMIGVSLCPGLKRHGYAVDWVKDGESAEVASLTEDYDLMLLDLGLPDLSGISVLQKMREAGNFLPVLILSAWDSLSDRVQGLDAGADDYLVKPFELKELEARMRALLRRRAGRVNPKIVAGDVSLDLVTKTVTYQGKTHVLPCREFTLMRALMERPGAILTAGQLEEKLYSWDERIGSNAVAVHIHLLRKKLGPDIIKTIRGMGYMVHVP